MNPRETPNMNPCETPSMSPCQTPSMNPGQTPKMLTNALLVALDMTASRCATPSGQQNWYTATPGDQQHW